VTETLLRGGDLNVVVRVGDTVRRPIGPWSPAVHALLQHFESVGFDGAPRFLGIDGQGREILSYVEGEPGFAPVPAGDHVLEELGRLLRSMHDSQATFVRPRDAAWQERPGESAEGEVVCHADLFRTNVIFRDGHPAALIDWDLAIPASRLVDVASAAYYWAPLRIDAEDVGLEPDVNRRGQRMRGLCDAYGLDRSDRLALVDVVCERRRLGYEAHRLWGGVERRPGWREMWDAGSSAQILANLRWIEEHRRELETWLR
jgi:hypothetical protein